MTKRIIIAKLLLLLVAGASAFHPFHMLPQQQQQYETTTTTTTTLWHSPRDKESTLSYMDAYHAMYQQHAKTVEEHQKEEHVLFGGRERALTVSEAVVESLLTIEKKVPGEVIQGATAATFAATWLVTSDLTCAGTLAALAAYTSITAAGGSVRLVGASCANAVAALVHHYHEFTREEKNQEKLHSLGTVLWTKVSSTSKLVAQQTTDLLVGSLQSRHELVTTTEENREKLKSVGNDLWNKASGVSKQVAQQTTDLMRSLESHREPGTTTNEENREKLQSMGNGLWNKASGVSKQVAQQTTDFMGSLESHREPGTTTDEENREKLQSMGSGLWNTASGVSKQVAQQTTDIMASLQSQQQEGWNAFTDYLKNNKVSDTFFSDAASFLQKNSPTNKTSKVQDEEVTTPNAVENFARGEVETQSSAKPAELSAQTAASFLQRNSPAEETPKVQAGEVTTPKALEKMTRDVVEAHSTEKPAQDLASSKRPADTRSRQDIEQTPVEPKDFQQAEENVATTKSEASSEEELARSLLEHRLKLKAQHRARRFEKRTSLESEAPLKPNEGNVPAQDSAAQKNAKPFSQTLLEHRLNLETRERSQSTRAQQQQHQENPFAALDAQHVDEKEARLEIKRKLTEDAAATSLEFQRGTGPSVGSSPPPAAGERRHGS